MVDVTRMDDPTEAAKSEIERLHAFLSGWLNGTLANTDAVFRDGIEDRLHADFFNIQPAGRLLTAPELLEALRAGWGKSPDFDIRIRNVRIHTVIEDARLILATYEEYQRGAQNSDRAENARFSSVLFQSNPNGQLTWVHIHETWLPEEKHDPALFAF